ncbi:MAG: phage protease [Puniceicoccales bacterium]
MNSTTIAGLSREIPTQDLRPSAWLRIAEYGNWPHAQGLQRFTRESAQELVRYFKSLRGRLARKFGGLPVFIGHPDDDNFAGQSGHTDTRAYAWIIALEAREDGLYALPRWSAAGRDLLRNAFYKYLSPRWAMKPLTDGAYTPVRLVSVGLTNHPNIPGDVIANETKAEANKHDDWYPSGNPRAEAAFTNERRERIAVLLDNAVLTGVIAPNERTSWEAGLQADFDRGLSELKTRTPALKTVACTTGLGARRMPTGSDFLTLVNERADRTGEPFAKAWNTLKQERPDLFHDFNTF